MLSYPNYKSKFLFLFCGRHGCTFLSQYLYTLVRGHYVHCVLETTRWMLLRYMGFPIHCNPCGWVVLLLRRWLKIHKFVIFLVCGKCSSPCLRMQIKLHIWCSFRVFHWLAWAHNTQIKSYVMGVIKKSWILLLLIINFFLLLLAVIPKSMKD
jgi:hypothetical protein